MIQNNKKVLGVILAGGLSKRMKGENKFFKKINNKTIIEHIILKASQQVTKLIINANINKSKFKKFDLDIIKDSVKGFKGPLAGILSAMQYGKKNNFKWLVTLPCDAPFFPFDLVNKLLKNAEKKKCKIVIVKSNNRTHPVIGIWSISLKKSLSNTLVKENIKKIDLFIKKHNFSIVNFSYDKIDPFFNINSYRDLDKAKKYQLAD